MLGKCLSLILLLTSLQHADMTESCGITGAFVSPEIITSYAEIYCDYDDDILNFNSFYLPSGNVLTTSMPDKYVIIYYTDRVVLAVGDIEESDSGSYSCNFRGENAEECFRVVEVVLPESVEFCTPNNEWYDAFIGNSITLKCCVQNYANQQWKTGGMSISENDRISFDGTHLQINPVTVEDQGVYKCIARNAEYQYREITAVLKVYLQLSLTIDPQAKVVNVSDRAELTCIAHGYPLPDIAWTREASVVLQLLDGIVEKHENEINSTTVSSTLTFISVRNEDTGTYRCTADNNNGSLHLTTSLQLFGTPSAPLNVELSVVNQTSILVTWDPPLDDGHLQLTEYSVMWFYKLDLSDLEYDTVNASIRHYIITDLLPVTNYTVTIYASNQRGNGKGSPDKNVFTLATVPAALSHLLTLHLTASSVQIEYTISPDTGGSPVTSLRIVYWADDEDSKNIEFPVTVPPQMNSYYLTGLKGDTLYFVRVSAGNLVGFGPETGRSFKTPIFVRVSDVGAMSIKLTWKVANVSQPYTEYHVYAMEDGSLSGGTRKITFRPDDVRRNALEETVEVTGLKDDTCYRFTVTIMNSKGTMIASLPSNRTCTLPCKDSTCPTASVGEIIAEDDSAQLIPILIVTIVVAILVVLVVVIVAILSRRYSRHRSSLNIVSSTNHDFTTLSLSSSHHGNSMEHPPPQSSSSSLSYPRQHSLVSQNSSSITDTEEAPATGSSVVSDNPFYFGNQDGSPQYQNRPHQYQNGAIVSVALCPNVAVLSEHPQTAGVKSMGSYPLFPIPENKVAMGHFEVSAPVIPNRPDRDATFMTDNPAFEKPQTIPISYNVTDTLDNNSEGSTPPPIPPYRGDSYSDTESNQPPPQIHVHTHVPPRSQSTQSVPCLGESYSQASRSPAMPQMPRTAFFLPEEAEDDEDDNTEFMENDAYESVSPKPQRREMFSQDSSTFVRSELKEPSYSKLSTSSLSRGRSLSPVFPRRGSTQSTASGNMPKFEIAKQQERGLVFETVNFKNHV